MVGKCRKIAVMTTATLTRIETVAPSARAAAARDVPSATAGGLLRSKSLAAAVWCAMFLLAIEGAVRVRAYFRYGLHATQADLYEADAVLGTTPRAGAVFGMKGTTTTINQWGMRGRDVALQRRAGCVRVLCLGESTSFGLPRDDDQAVWPAQLERILAGRANVNIEVLNGAVTGYTTRQSRLNFQRRMARFEPDVVVILHAATDLSAQVRRQFGGGESTTDGVWSLDALRDRASLSYMLLRRNTAALLATQFKSTRHDRLDDKADDEFEADLAALVAQCRQGGRRVVLCTFPRAFDRELPVSLAESALFFNPQLSLEGLVDGYERFNQAIRRVAQSEGLTLVDLDRDIPRGRECFVDAVHFSDVGYAAVAAVLADALQPVIEQQAARGGDARNAVQ